MKLAGCKKKFLLGTGLFLGFLTIPVLILLVYGIAVGWNVLGLVIAAVMLGLPAAFFAFLGFREPEEKPVTMDKTLERRVLQLAAANDGELTAAKLALGSQLKVDECQEVLEHFEAMDVARGHVGERGEMRYTFPELRESMAAEDDFMRRLEQEDPRAVLDFDASEYEDEEEVVEEKVEVDRDR